MLSRKSYHIDRWWSGAAFLVGMVLASTPAVAQEKIYFTAPDAIDRVNLDGSGLETIFSQAGTVQSVLALDLDARRLYWSDTATLEIKRATLFGQNVEVLVTGPRAWGIALDPANDLMYWSNDVGDVFPPGVYRSAIDGTNPELVIPSDGRAIMGVALDTVHGKLYWTVVTGTPRLIRRANLDGTAVETIVEFPDRPAPVALALDADGGRLYWAAKDILTLLDGSVGRSRLDGSAVEVLFEPVTASGISLDLPRGHLYWTSTDHTIQRANLDGSGRIVMDLGIIGLRGIAIDTRPAVPIPAVSAWALLSLSLALSAAGTIVLRRPHCR